MTFYFLSLHKIVECTWHFIVSLVEVQLIPEGWSCFVLYRLWSSKFFLLDSFSRKTVSSENKKRSYLHANVTATQIIWTGWWNFHPAQKIAQFAAIYPYGILTDAPMRCILFLPFMPLNRILRIWWPEKIKNEELLERTAHKPVRSIIGRRTCLWIGHTKKT